VVQARAAAYEAVERTEQPWSADDLKPRRRAPEPTGLVRGHLQAVR
jgi:hypothetical protein